MRKEYGVNIHAEEGSKMSGFVFRVSRTVIVCLLTCLFLIAIPVVGQTNERPGRWLPFHNEDFSVWKENVAQDPSFPVTRKDIDLTIRKLADINAVFREAPGLRSPGDFVVRPHRALSLPLAGTVGAEEFKRSAMPFVSSLLIQMFVPAVKEAFLGEASGYFSVTINAIKPIFRLRGPPFAEDERGAMFIEPRVVGKVAGFPEYHTDYVVMKLNDRPLWVAVSQERLIRNEIRKAEKTLNEIESNLPESDLDRMIKEMKKNQEKTLEQMKVLLSKQEFEERKREGEAASSQFEAALRARQPQSVALQNKALTQARQWVAELNDELNSLTAAQRASEAWIAAPDSKKKGKKLRPSMLANIGDKGLARVVEINRDYFDKSLPRSAFQVITVIRNTSYLGEYSEKVLRPVSDSVWKTLDWKHIATTLGR